jgi:hypothetical protein
MIGARARWFGKTHKLVNLLIAIVAPSTNTVSVPDRTQPGKAQLHRIMRTHIAILVATLSAGSLNAKDIQAPQRGEAEHPPEITLTGKLGIDTFDGKEVCDHRQQ